MSGHQRYSAILLAVGLALPCHASEPGTKPRADLNIREMVSTLSEGFVYRALKGESEIYPFIVIEKLRPGATEGDETVLVASWRGRDMKGGSVLTETFEGDDFTDLRWSGGRLRFTFQKHGGNLICTVSGVEADQPAVSCRSAKPAVR